MVDFWGNVGFLVFTFSTVVFTILYISMSRWYKSFVGSAIAVYTVSVIILCVYLSLRIWDVTLPGVEWLRLIIFWVLGLVMLASVIGFLEVQFGRRGVKLRERLSKRYNDIDKR